MGSYLSKPQTQKAVDQGSNSKLTYGVASMQGWRKTMEDDHIAKMNCDDEQTCVFGVFDGHGGREVSQFVVLCMIQTLQKSKNYKQNLEQALIETFLSIDQKLSLEASKENLINLQNESSYLAKLESKKQGQTTYGYFQETKQQQQQEEEVEEEVVDFKQEDEKESVSDNQNSMLKSQSIQDQAKFLQQACPFITQDDQNRKSVDERSLQSNSFRNFLLSEEQSQNEQDEDDKNGTTKQQGQEKAIGETKDSLKEQSQSKQHAQPSQHDISNLSIKTPIRRTQALDESSKTPPFTDREKCKCKEIKEKDEESIKEQGQGGGSAQANGITKDPSNDMCKTCGKGSEKQDEIHGGPKAQSTEYKHIQAQEKNKTENKYYDNGFVDPVSGKYVGPTAGSTANFVVVRNDKIYVANIGDSRSVLSQAGHAIALSEDHKPQMDLEKQRIEKAGGFLMAGRVNGCLNLSRAFGDFEYKRENKLNQSDQIVSCTPDVTILDMHPDFEFLIIACDGIWDCYSNQECVDFVRKGLIKGTEPQDICTQLCDDCLAPNVTDSEKGCDNMTVIVVVFKDALTRLRSSK